MITEAGILRALGIFSLMKFFPGDDGTRAALGELLCEMCRNDEEIIWLARRVQKLHREWPGAHEIRAAYCSKFQPKDGIEADSNLYLDGIPSETGRQEFEQPRLPAGATSKQITAAREAIAPPDPEVEKLLSEAVRANTLSKLPTMRYISADERRVDEELRALLHLPSAYTPPPARPPQTITAEQVEEARRLELERRAKGAPAK